MQKRLFCLGMRDNEVPYPIQQALEKIASALQEGDEKEQIKFAIHYITELESVLTEKEGSGLIVDSLKKGVKLDQGKQNWYAMPLVVLQPLADVFRAGELKYETFNCLNPFDDSDRRFWDGMMRHAEECQIDPLAIDKELYDKYGIKVYHGAQIAFNALMRVRNALMRKEGLKND